MPIPTLAIPTSASAALTAKLPAGEDNAPAEAKIAGAVSFAAHLQRFAARGTDTELVTGPITLLPEENDASAVELAASTVLDPLALAQQRGTADSVPAEDSPRLTESSPDAAAPPLFAPLTPPIVAAANSAAVTAATAAEGRFPAAAVTLPFAAATRDLAPQAGIESVVPTKTEVPSAASTSREFASTLTAAIATTHETQSPGDTAAVVQQVIADLSPARSAHAHEGLTITRPVGTPGWTEEIGNRLAWIAGQGRSQAELVLNPPHMGRIEVSLTVNGDQAAASFASSNPVVRELLEASLPRLRETLADAGIQLGQAQVGAEHPRQQAQQEKHGENPASDPMRTLGTNAAISQANSVGLSTSLALKSGRSLVDVFA